MKYNFIVSDYRKLWIEDISRLFILDPYVYFQLKKGGNITNYDDVIVAPHRRKSCSDLEKDHNYVQLKFVKYVNILSERLNQIHDTCYGMPFWRKTLSLSLERYITFLYEMFQNCELYFNLNKHDCYVLSKESYHTPFDFDEQRNDFQYSNYGQEQMYSIYMHIFYPSGLKTLNCNYKYKGKVESSTKSTKISLIIRLLKQDLSRVTLEKVKRLLLNKYYSRNDIVIGIMGSFFSRKYLDLLVKESKGSIYPISWNIDQKDDGTLFLNERKYLSEDQHGFDKFDKYFFTSIEYCFPKIFVEYFKNVEQYYENYFNRFKKLKFVTSEAWLSDNSLCIALALLRERGVKHIYNEHNYLEHPWVGSLIHKEAELSDIFVSMGWYSKKIDNMVRGASLFDFKLDEKPIKRYKISYISGRPKAKRPLYTSSYGWNCENAQKSFTFVKLFFSNLSYQCRSEILFKDYPVSNPEDWLAYDQEFMLDPYLKHVQKANDISVPAKLIMLQSNLVIIDYISTSYLEALIMNIPTIFFWNTNIYYLHNDYSDFFDLLISAGICQTDPIIAAHFVESIKDNPGKWWYSEKVQNSRKEFLNKNIGNPKNMIDFLLKLIGNMN